MHSFCKKFWKAETEHFSTIPSILYMSILDISISNAFNAIYVEAIDTLSTQYTQCNGMHVDAVNTIKLQCRF